MSTTSQTKHREVRGANPLLLVTMISAIMLGSIGNSEAADPSTSTIGDSKFRIISAGPVNVGANSLVTLVIQCASNEQIISTGIDTTDLNNGKGFSIIDDAPTSYRKWVKRMRNLNPSPVKVSIRAICNSKK